MTAELTPEQWLDDMAANVAADDADAERQAIENILPLWEARKAEAAYKKEIENLRKPIDTWLRLHPGETELRDEERGARVYLRSGGLTDVFDAPAAIKGRDPGLYSRLEELGCFRVDGDAVKKAIADGLLMATDIAPFRSYRERTPSLLTEYRS